MFLTMFPLRHERTANLEVLISVIDIDADFLSQIDGAGPRRIELSR